MIRSSAWRSISAGQSMLSTSRSGSSVTTVGRRTLSISLAVSIEVSLSLSPTTSHQSLKRGMLPCSRDQTRPRIEQPIVTCLPPSQPMPLSNAFTDAFLREPKGTGNFRAGVVRI